MTPGQARIALLSFLACDDRRGGERAVPAEQARVATKAPTARPTAGPPADRGRRSSEATRADRSKPAPSEAAAKEQTLRIARFAPDTAMLDAPLPAPQGEAGIETVRAIQRELKSRGYGPLAGDGVMGLATRAGIMAFEHDQGWG